MDTGNLSFSTVLYKREPLPAGSQSRPTPPMKVWWTSRQKTSQLLTTTFKQIWMNLSWFLSELRLATFGPM